MPQRTDRFFWVRAEEIPARLATVVNREHQKFVRWQTVCSMALHMCTDPVLSSKHLWLIRAEVGMKGGKAAAQINKLITAPIERVGKKLGNVRLRRVLNLPTPLVTERLCNPFRTDIGLHAVNDRYNGMLVSFTDHEGRFYNPPHFQLNGLKAICAKLRQQWNSLACGCHARKCHDCHGSGLLRMFSRAMLDVWRYRMAKLLIVGCGWLSNRLQFGIPSRSTE